MRQCWRNNCKWHYDDKVCCFVLSTDLKLSGGLMLLTLSLNLTFSYLGAIYFRETERRTEKDYQTLYGIHSK